MNKRTSLCLLVLTFATAGLAAGCADPDPTAIPGDPAVEEEADSLDQAGDDSVMTRGMAEAVRLHDEARLAGAEDPVAEAATTRFSRSQVLAGRGAEHTFGVRGVVTGEDGDRHARLDHFYKGVRVLGSTAFVRTTEAGDTLEEDANDVRGPVALDTTPVLSVKEALAVVNGRAERTGLPLIAPRSELVIFPVEERFVKATGAKVTGEEEGLNALDVERRVVDHQLVYQIDTLDQGRVAPIASYRYLVSARSGEVLRVTSLVHTDQGVGKSFKNAGPFGGNLVPIDTLKHVNGAQTTFEPFDSFRGFGVWDDDTCHTCGDNADIADNTWGDSKAFTGDASATFANRQTAVVDGLFGMQATWDMFKDVFGRFGYNNSFYAGHAYVHVSTDWDDASYSSLSGNISVGDSGSGNRSSRTTLDTLAHEYGHGLNDFTAGLGGNNEGEGLNEASSDIFGEISEAFVLGGGQFNALSTIPASPGPNWVNVGSGRSFANPNGPRYWTSSLAGIADEHTRAMPMDHGFFFLSQGSINDPVSPQFSINAPWGMKGIGIDAAARIWFRALTMKFTSNTDYADARAKCVTAAGELFGSGSTQQKAVQNAFAAINVGATASGYPAAAVLIGESEPNNSLSQTDTVTPGALPAGAPVNGALFKRTNVVGQVSSGDTADFYSVLVPAGKTLRVTLLPSNDDDIDLFDGFDTLVDSSANGGTLADQVTVTTPNDGLLHPFTFKVKFFSMAGALVPAYQVFVDIL